jgi:ABC-type transport system involved in cytochrome bd biosynthesis fused ATPase/permease subunit
MEVAPAPGAIGRAWSLLKGALCQSQDDGDDAIAHCLSTICHSDYINVMEYGRIVEQGKHENLLVQNIIDAAP